MPNPSHWASAKNRAVDTARSHPSAQPRVILFDTLMGKGVPFLEQREKNHFIRVDAHETSLTSLLRTASVALSTLLQSKVENHARPETVPMTADVTFDVFPGLLFDV